MFLRSITLPDGHLAVEYGLHKIGDQLPYFSVTASEWSSLAHARRWPDSPHSCGQMHDRVLEAFPDMADLVALHLSDVNGVPMHVIENGWWYCQSAAYASLANHLRVPRNELRSFSNKLEFIDYVAAQSDRWATEARAAIEKYELDEADYVEDIAEEGLS